jgi:IS5 family transposase
MKPSVLVEGYGIPMGRVLAGAHRHDSPLLASTLDQLGELGPLPEEITVHLDAGYDSGKTRDTLAARGLNAEIARKGEHARGRRHRSRPSGGMWMAPRPEDVHVAAADLQGKEDVDPFQGYRAVHVEEAQPAWS